MTSIKRRTKMGQWKDSRPWDRIGIRVLALLPTSQEASGKLPPSRWFSFHKTRLIIYLITRKSLLILLYVTM